MIHIPKNIENLSLFIQIFDGKVEVRKSSDFSLVMEGIEEGGLLKLQGSSTHVQKFSFISHHEDRKSVV